MSEKKRILSRFEWLLLIISLVILLFVILQNNGIHVVETVESVELTKADQPRYERPETKAPSSTPSNENGQERLKSLFNYFEENRATARAEGKEVGFDWSSLRIDKDEEQYLKKRYGNEPTGESSTDWLSAISASYNTYKSVKSAFQEVGIDPDKILNSQNAAKALSNPVLATSIYEKIERDFGIPAEKSRAFAEQNQQNLERWAEFVERERK